jgi:hypothetical protein
MLMTVACGKSAVSYPNAGAVAAALRSGHVTCDSLLDLGRARLVADVGSCSSGADKIEIYVFDSSSKLDDWKKVGTRLLPTVIGPNWAVSAPDRIAKEAAGALHGDLVES